MVESSLYGVRYHAFVVFQKKNKKVLRLLECFVFYWQVQMIEIDTDCWIKKRVITNSLYSKKKYQFCVSWGLLLVNMTYYYIHAINQLWNLFEKKQHRYCAVTTKIKKHVRLKCSCIKIIISKRNIYCFVFSSF